MTYKYVGFVFDTNDKCHPLFASTIKELQATIDREVNGDYKELGDRPPWGYIAEAKSVRDITIDPRLIIQAKIEVKDD